MSDEQKTTLGVETPETPVIEGKAEEKLLTQEQFDRALKERLEREHLKSQKEIDAKIKEVREETEKMALLSSEEKEKELTSKLKGELDTKAKELAIRENKLDASDMFAKANIPVELVTYVIDPDKEKTLENAEVFIKNYNESVAQKVADQLKGNPPKDISINSKTEPAKVVTSF